MEQLYGIFLYAVFLLTMGGIYAVLTLGLNIQWGFTGLFNAGGRRVLRGRRLYLGFPHHPPPPSATSAGSASRPERGWRPRWSQAPSSRGGWPGSASAFAATTSPSRPSGSPRILRLVLKNETWATNGARGVSLIPKPFEHLPEPWNQVAMLMLVFAIVLVLYGLLERAQRAPWGRVMSAIRENEAAARAAGKDVEKLRVEAFILGGAVMGLGGALMAHHIKFIDPNMAEPVSATFLVWVMLVIGGSANNRGAILGALLVWTIWSTTEIITTRLPTEWALKAAYLRIFLVGLALQFILQRYPGGIFRERRLRTTATASSQRGESQP